MSILDLKQAMVHRIEALTNEADVVDLYKTVGLFFDNREDDSVSSENNPATVQQLNESLTEAKAIGYKGITTPELQVKMNEWLTK